MADKTYRVQATPLGKGAAGGGAGRSKFAITPKTKPPASKYDDSPLSSPEPEAPQLNAEIFGDSPLKPSTLALPVQVPVDDTSMRRLVLVQVDCVSPLSLGRVS